jgi:cardiolipin synthase|tara:strand:+ start:659 stop:1225 length:567 start_codon:yes stop_codon:yes gene_type:complete
LNYETLKLNIPNLISLARLISIPFTVWLVLNGSMLAAFWVFVAAGISDALDGYIAKRFDLRSEIGGFLDPIADKALLVSVFVTLGSAGFLENWLVILVVFRDALIVIGAFVYQFLYQDLTMHPLLSSKINTTFQFLLAMGVMGSAGFAVPAVAELHLAAYAVAVTTIWSGAAYVIIWGRRATALEPGE